MAFSMARPDGPARWSDPMFGWTRAPRDCPISYRVGRRMSGLKHVN
jgi:hypothetical protein